MRILLVHAGAEVSIWDVSQGYRAALARAAHDVRDYYLSRRLMYHAQAMGGHERAFFGGDELSYHRAVCKQASETVVVEALYHKAELVLFVCGLAFHPLGLQLLETTGIPAAVILTESPYDDPHQAEWCAAFPGMQVFTHERISAARYGWGYLPHAYDPAIHRPVEPDPALACDVLFLGTGWAERQQWLEAVDWTGITLHLRGLWPTLRDASPLWPMYVEGVISNPEAPRYYASAKIVLNLHRQGAGAESLNPRAYEVAACGAFQLSDVRAAGVELFGAAVPTVTSPAELDRAIHYYLDHSELRAACACDSRQRVAGQTFDARVAALMAALDRHLVRRCA